MLSKKKLWLYAIGFSYAGLLAMLARTFLDYQYVYGSLGFTPLTSGLATMINLLIFGGWIYALYASAARFSRGAMIVNLVFNALLLIFGLSTVISLCPSPCPTGWPVGEIIIWSNIVVGIPALIASTIAALRPVSASGSNDMRQKAAA
jgi:hypothetical protein